MNQKPETQDDIDLKREVLLHFRKDNTTTALYERLEAKGYTTRAVQNVFLSLKRLGYITQTNLQKTSAAVYCITRLGRELVEYEYGISLPHPDAPPSQVTLI